MTNKKRFNIKAEEVERLMNLGYSHEGIGMMLKTGATPDRCRNNISRFLKDFDIIEVTPRVVKLVPKKGKS